MTELAEPTPSKKWRPRFSLRTLMIGVLLIAFSWTATAIWGVPSVVERAEQESKLDDFQKRMIGSAGARGEGVALCPFWVRRGINYPDGSILIQQDWIWFFGYMHALNDETTPRKTKPGDP